MKRCQVFPYWSGQEENFQNFSLAGGGVGGVGGGLKGLHLQWSFVIYNDVTILLKMQALGKTFLNL